MSDVPSASEPTYTTAALVAAKMQEDAPSVHANRTPDVDEYNAAILAVEEVIDQWCGTAWRTRTVTNHYPDHVTNYPDEEGFLFVPLAHRHIKDLDSGQGDALEVWNGSQFEDWLTTRSEGRNRDYYLVPELGELYLRLRIIFGSMDRRVRVTYRYGQTVVPGAVQRAATLLAAADLATGSVTSVATTQGGLDIMGTDPRTTRWIRTAEALLGPYLKVGA